MLYKISQTDFPANLLQFFISENLLGDELKLCHAWDNLTSMAPTQLDQFLLEPLQQGFPYIQQHNAKKHTF